MLFENLLDTLVTPLAPARAAALTPIVEAAAAHADVIAVLRSTWYDTVVEIGYIDSKALQHKIAPEFAPFLGLVRNTASELVQAFDAVPVDLRDAVRAARAARSDRDFDAALRTCERELDRLAGKARTVGRQCSQLQKFLATLDEAGAALFSASFVPSPSAPGIATE